MVSEDRISKFGSQFAVGTCHPCRVIQLNLIDGVVVVSLQKYALAYFCYCRGDDVFYTCRSVLERPFMRYKDIVVGELVSVSVCSVVCTFPTVYHFTRALCYVMNHMACWSN